VASSASSTTARSASAALALLQEKYPQHRTELPDGPVLAVDITEVREWSS
jgi:hypothetical protein